MGDTRHDLGQLEDDPFWAVIHRRHPDVDVVLLPDEPAPTEATTTHETAELTDADVTRLDARTLKTWCALADLEAAGPETRWIAGLSLEDVRREATLIAEGVDPLAGTAVLEEAVASLRAEGWHVMAPPDGVPRVLASREPVDGAPGSTGREELQLLLAPGAGRLVLRHRSAGVPVGRDVARRLITGDHP